MKKLITILILFIGVYSFGQDVVGSRIIAKQALYVNGIWVDSIRVDTVNISGDNRTLMTSGAIYKFVSNRSGGGGGGSGTVTSVSAGFGHSFSTITTTGSVISDTTSGGVLSWVRGTKIADSLGAIISTKGTGTVTNVGSGYGTNFSAITTTGSVIVDTFAIATRARVQKAVDSLNVNIATKGAGTVTSVGTGYGLTGGSITTTGTIVLDSATVFPQIRATISGGSGTVTSVAAGFGTNFSTITSTGSVIADTTSGGVQSWVRGQYRQDSSVSKGSVVGTVPNFEPWYTVYLVTTAGGSFGGFYWTSSGTGASVTNFLGTNIPDGWLYGQIMQTGTTTTGFAFHYASMAAGTLGTLSINTSFRYNYGEKVRFDTLSDGTNTYNYWCGFADDITAHTSIVDGIYFRYTNADSSGKWIMCTRSNTTLTEKATSTTVAANTDYELEISVFGGTAYFYVNKVLAGTISTNVPSGSTRQTDMLNVIRKSAGTIGRTANIEWMAYGKRHN